MAGPFTEDMGTLGAVLGGVLDVLLGGVMASVLAVTHDVGRAAPRRGPSRIGWLRG